MKGAQANKSRVQPWWLAEDSESCSSCSHPYAHRTEIFCFDCDAPICPICIERTTTFELICPGCVKARSSEEVL
jgi:hypothetical protein